MYLKNRNLPGREYFKAHLTFNMPFVAIVKLDSLSISFDRVSNLISIKCRFKREKRVMILQKLDFSFKYIQTVGAHC